MSSTTTEGITNHLGKDLATSRVGSRRSASAYNAVEKAAQAWSRLWWWSRNNHSWNVPIRHALKRQIPLQNRYSRKNQKAARMPEQHFVDGGYRESTHLVESRRQYGMELIGPVQSNGRWQQEQATGFDIGYFDIDWEKKQALCPEGKTSSSWKAGIEGRGHEVISVSFAKVDCHPCPSRSKCTKAKLPRRILHLKPQALHQALQQARRRQRTEEFRKQYQQRAGVEGTISQGVRAFELRRARYVGIAKVRLQHFATAAALNLERIADWLAGERPELTRQSAFTPVMQPRAA